jgi:hypothetical protein
MRYSKAESKVEMKGMAKMILTAKVQSLTMTVGLRRWMGMRVGGELRQGKHQRRRLHHLTI